MSKQIEKLANDLIPGDVFHPGEYIKDELEAREMSQNDLAIKLGISKTTVSSIIHGRRNLTPTVAVKLEEVLEISAEFWMNLQIKYDIDKIKKKYASKIKNSSLAKGKKETFREIVKVA